MVATRRRGLPAALALLLLVLAGALGVARHMPPAPLAADAPVEQFSAGRALRDIEAIARIPHPIGSAEHARVRAYLVDRLRAQGFDTEVQQSLGVNRKIGVAAPVANIVARKRGSGSGGGKAIMLVAHYDSVPMGPGASDDGAGVAALLEAGRWLDTQPALRNDVILLISDGEEFGLLGAEGFVAEHRWAKDVGLVVNVEARGHTGPSILFETSPHNSSLIAGLRRYVQSAVANSLTYEVYRQLPNDTDFSVFKRVGMSGVNVAYMGGVTHYHSAMDTPANVDLRSLQHHGEYLTGLLQAFGHSELPLPDTGDAIYFNAPWLGIVQYSPRLALPLAALGMLQVGGLLVAARRRGELGAVLLAGSLLRVMALLAGAGLAGWAFWEGLRQANPNFHWLSNGDGYHTELLLYGLLALIAAGVAALAGRRAADRAACWLVWALLALGTAVYLPGASWLFVWPLLAGVAGQLVAEWPRATRAVPWLALGLTPLAFLAAPLLWLLFSALGPALLPVIALFAALCLLPVAPLLAPARGRPLYFVLLLAGLGLVGSGLARSGFNVEARKPNHVIYLLERFATEPTKAHARWLTADEDLDAWTGQFLGAQSTRAPVPELGRSRPVQQSEAPVFELPLPLMRIAADDTANGVHRTTLRVDTFANVLTLLADGESAVRKVQVDGKTIFDAAEGQAFRRVQIAAPPAAGMDLLFELPAGAALKLQVLQQFWGLPEAQIFPQAQRGADMMMTPTRQADSRFTLDRWAD